MTRLTATITQTRAEEPIAGARRTSEPCCDDCGASPAPDPGCEYGFYVTCIRSARQRALVLGPFETHPEALAAVDRGRQLALEADSHCVFDAFGTARLVASPGAELPGGKLNPAPIAGGAPGADELAPAEGAPAEGAPGQPLGEAPLERFERAEATQRYSAALAAARERAWRERELREERLRSERAEQGQQQTAPPPEQRKLRRGPHCEAAPA